MPEEIAPAYLIAGTDEGKISAAIARLRARAERESGAGTLRAFAPDAPGRGPDPAPLLAEIPAMSLVAEHRYLLAEGVERWTAKQAGAVAAALAELPPDLTVVLVAHESPPRVRAPKALGSAVKKAGGKVLTFEAPKARELPSWLVAEAKRRNLELDRDAAALLIDRMGESTIRLGNELDRLGLWAADGARITRTELERMIADTSEEAAWALSDALVSGEPGQALRAAERLVGQGETVTGLVYQAGKRLREAHTALAALESGRPAKEVETSLSMHPYAAKQLVRRLRGASLDDLRAATCAIADLEWWTRGGSDYPEPVALTLAIRRATSGDSD